jgi:hypothetical protein
VPAEQVAIPPITSMLNAGHTNGGVMPFFASDLGEQGQQAVIGVWRQG